MSRNSKVIPYAELFNEELSIIEISRKVVSFYRELENVNKAFGLISIVSEKRARQEVIDIKSDNAVEQLAEEILLQNRDDIIKTDKADDLDVHYNRIGNYINFSLGVEVNKEPLLTLSFSFIQSDRAKSKIGTLVASEKCFNNIEDCISFVELLIGNFKIEYASMKMNYFDREVNKEVRRYKAPLGLVTYFSKREYSRIPLNYLGSLIPVKKMESF